MRRICLTILLAVVCLGTGFGLGMATAYARNSAEIRAEATEQTTVLHTELEEETAAPETKPEEAVTAPVTEPTGETGTVPGETEDGAEPLPAETEGLPEETEPESTIPCGEEAVTISEIPIPYMEWNGVVRLCQQDSRWASERYSRKNVGLGGCGLVSLSRALTYATGEEISPMDLIDMETPYGLKYRYASKLGTDSNLYKDWAGQLNVSTLRTANANVARYEMETKGAVAITKVQGGTLSAAGHYVLLVELDDSQAVILDPTIEGIMRTPEGVVNNLAVTSHASEYVLVYPVDTELPTQEEFWDYTLKLPHAVDQYPEVQQAMQAHERLPAEETTAGESA